MTLPVMAPWPNFSKHEGDLVRDVLMSNRVNYWTGECGRLFESAFASMAGTKHSIALANGTLALDLALIALEIGLGDEVIVTPRSFMASASAIHNCGAIPVFADVHPDSQNITADTIEAVVTEKTRAVVCVHLAGWPCDMDSITTLSKKYGFAVIEDCAQAHGAFYKGKSVGSIGDIGTWSFCQDKIMTTGGEGGMVTTNSDELYERMWSYKDHGKSRLKMENPEPNRRFKYVHDSFGSNFRMTEMQSAIGHYQLSQLDKWTQQRTSNAMYYHNHLSELAVVRSELSPQDVEHAFYKFYFFLESARLASGWDRDRIVEQIAENGGSCFSGSCPELYKEAAFVSAYGHQRELENAQALGRDSLMLNCHPGISGAYLEYNYQIIKDVLLRAMQ